MGSKGPRKMQILIPEISRDNKPITFKPINVFIIVILQIITL